MYSRRSYEKASQAMRLYGFVKTKQIEMIFKKAPRKNSYRQRIIQAFEKDPFWCTHCHRKMDLVEVVHPEQGLLYHYMFEL